jgi:hypothetical protein
MRPKNIFFILFFVLGSHVIWTQKTDRITMIWQENVCPPAWLSFGNDQQTLANLKELLLQDSIEVFKMRFTGTPYQTTCAGCQCLTGRNLEIVINRKDQAKLEAQDFYRPWAWMDKTEHICDWTMGLTDELIEDSLSKKNIRLQGFFSTGLSEKKNENCSTPSGRLFTIKVDRDDLDKAKKEGFVENKNFKQY